MIVRTLLLFALLGAAACAELPTETANAPVAADPAGWRLSSGKTPTKAEFVALSATCEAKGGDPDACFKELGLKRAP
ncbi:MAG TPA: hypothetical protein VG651_02855 [Stellaceae bacterium]|nr:hypothetical protein [Stellaceae bacterium]